MLRKMVVNSRMWGYEVHPEYARILRPDGVSVVVVLTARVAPAKVASFVRTTIHEIDYGQPH